MIETLFFNGIMLKKMQYHRYYPVFLSLLSSVLFWLSWPPNCLTPLLFVALVPLLLILGHINNYQYQRPYWTFYKYTYWTLFLWNLTTTWWVAHATIVGAVLMLFFNTFCMSLPLPLFQFTTRHFGRSVGYISLLTYWVSMEHVHLQWELSFPWLNLGNGLACWPEWVQWYAYTGSLGGTVWILTVNLLLFLLLSIKKTTTQFRIGGVAGFWIVLPILVSYYMYWNYEEQGKEVEVVVIQPNINPYTGEFVDTGAVLSAQERVARFIELSEIQLSTETQFLVWPEVAIDGLFDEQLMGEYPLIDQLVSFTQSHPQLSLLVGLNSLVGYGSEKATKTARFSHRHGYYDIFNTALFVGNQGTLATYHKSKLVPGVELVPYLYNLEIPKELLPNARGRLNSLGIQDRPRVFFNQGGTGIAPIICYESVYGDYLTDFVRMGASLIFSMTIDGWWKNTPGYQQHFHYTRLRAVESRRSIARSALKGISAFINQRGDILQAAQYKDQAAMRYTLRANSTPTFYVRHNNYIASTMLWASLFLIIGSVLSKACTRYTREAAYSAYNTKDKHGSR
jgi:apolipoprotein N-acyltransferase